MKNRDYKNFRPGLSYHIYNRGNHEQDIFLEKSDYLNFIKRCRIALGYANDCSDLRIQPLPANTFDILSYCLMPNHFHIEITQLKNVGIDRFITKVCTSYASYFNKKYRLTGHIFQDTFKAIHVDCDEYLLHLSAYIHNNPPNPLTYGFSSLSEIVGRQKPVLCPRKTILKLFEDSPQSYLEFVINCQKNKLHKKLIKTIDF
jgi:putative transposase